MPYTIEDEVVRITTRVALCNRLDAALDQAAKYRREIQRLDQQFADKQQADLFREETKPSVRP